jgi:hypothetical protein
MVQAREESCGWGIRRRHELSGRGWSQRRRLRRVEEMSRSDDLIIFRACEGTTIHGVLKFTQDGSELIFFQ